MSASDGWGLPLVGEGKFAADLICFGPFGQTAAHTHPGAHILYVLAGDGVLNFCGKEYHLAQHDCYYVPGEAPHSVHALESDLVLLSVANDHRPVDSTQRLEIVSDA